MRRVLLCVFATTMFAACTHNTINEAKKEVSGAEIIYASIDATTDTEDNDSNTRVELNDKKQTVWTAGDNIFTFDNRGFKLWMFDGKTGDRSGSFIHIGNYGTPDPGYVNYDQYYAIYLADLSYGAYSDKSPMFFTTLPSTQSYKAQSYGLNTNAMIGTSSDGTNYKFKNLFSYIRLSITGGKIVDSIVIKGRNNEAIAGSYYFNKDGELTLYQNQEYSITLDCENGVQLTDIPIDFYITMPPITLSKGITVTINFTDGTVFTKSTSKSIILERNTIQPMKSFSTGGEVEWQTIVISHSGDMVYSPYFYGTSALSGFIYWGDDYMSNINSTSSYTYDDNEASHAITTKTTNATAVEIIDCTGISIIDLTNF